MDNIPNDMVESKGSISNTTIAVLVIILLVVSVLGTMVLLNTKASGPAATTATSKTGNTAKVTLEINAPTTVQHSQDTGSIVLDIKR